MIIRKPSADDADAIARVHVGTWRTAYKGILPDDYLAKLSYEARRQMWEKSLSNPDSTHMVHVAEHESNGIVGFADGGPERHGDSRYKAELYGIYVLAEYQRQGIGTMLMQAVAGELAQRGFVNIVLWALEANHPTRAFYEALGGRQVCTQEGKVAYAWENIEELALSDSKLNNRM